MPGPIKTFEAKFTRSQQTFKLSQQVTEFSADGLWEFQVRSIAVTLREPKLSLYSFSVNWLLSYYKNKLQYAPIEYIKTDLSSRLFVVEGSQSWFQINNMTNIFEATLSSMDNENVAFFECLIYFRRVK